MQHTARSIRSDEDFWQVRKLLADTYPITPLGFNWDVGRWESKRFYDAIPAWDPGFVARVRLWETAGGRLVGVVNPEGTGRAYLQVHPDHRHLEDEMVGWAEEYLASASEEGRRLDIEMLDSDLPRQEMLERRGFARTPLGGFTRRLRFEDQAFPPSPVPPEYELRTTLAEDLADCQRIADLLNAAFNRNSHKTDDYRMFTKHAPSYRRDLDLVAVAPDRTFAAYVGIQYEHTNCRGVFEPVCTHPAHRRKGLAKTLMLHGLHRLQAKGARDVTVDTGDMIAANRLYEGVGLLESVHRSVWRKEL